MKKTVLIFLLVSTVSAFSQNIQLHYDMLDGRQQLTTTVEMFKPDKWGNTFFFVDMNYGVEDLSKDNASGVNLAYWEIARVFKHEALPIGFHAEFDGGLGRFTTPLGDGGYRINEAWLAGVDYSWNTSDFSKGFSLKALYKYIVDIPKSNSFQLTGVWYAHFLDRKVTFNGFVDFWKQGDDYVMLSEPQLWYNFNKNFSAGGEVEFSNNFAGQDGFKVYPTVALKYTF